MRKVITVGTQMVDAIMRGVDQGQALPASTRSLIYQRARDAASMWSAGAPIIRTAAPLQRGSGTRGPQVQG